MERITYVKYNSTRRPEYRITTEIHENEKEKWVVKRAGSAEAQKHLERIANNQELLETKVYKNISVQEVKKEENRLCFPFVDGKVLADQIDQTKLDKDLFVDQVNQSFERILSVRDECECAFEPTEAFVSCFGELFPEKGVPALCPANLDSVFSNFIETENGLVCLDYEWVYDFPIPVDFIKYRCIRYFYNEREKSLFDGIPRDMVMEWFGFDSTTLETFWSMESHFQQQIYGKNWQYLYLNRYKKEETTLQKLDELIKEQDNIIRYNEACIREKEHLIKEQENVIKYNEACIQEINKQVQNLGNEIKSREEAIAELNSRISDQEKRLQEWSMNYQSIINSSSWRLTKPLRCVGAFFRRTVKKQ